jgi:hypothetical protein
MGRGRKPLGDRAMTDAERQRRHRQRLRQAQADTVTGACHENGAADKKTIDRLRKENQRLRQEVKDLEDLRLQALDLRDQVLGRENQKIKRLEEEVDRLRRETSRYGAWKAEKDLYDMLASIDPRIVQKVRNDLAKKYHPDRGGSTEAMQAVNEFYDRLVAALRAKQEG